MKEVNIVNNVNNEIVDFLFRTNAIEVCEPGKPFFYTSGKLGPYYINTHYLYGSKQDAQALLDIMDKNSQDHDVLNKLVTDSVMKQYNENIIFKSVITKLAEVASEYSFDLISGGERRDFFFSIPVASILGVPHLSIFKDGSTIYEGDVPLGKTCLHIADLVTEASSYIRAWIPVVNDLKVDMKYSLSVVDRNQGGNKVLCDAGIMFKALAVIEDSFFETAFRNGYINREQLVMITNFMKDPQKFMLDFFRSDPGFLERQIEAGGKSRERALRCIEYGYNLPVEGSNA
ncbi:MAG: orotate phosphoribosyltransferase [Eubacteriales bacterium]|nr:orotate phosphoribosyltransferase [Eubacteriales bacterium]NCU25795.1 orotate phosphoribosyltransferase [Candidatus Nomurabacteria bacterium]